MLNFLRKRTEFDRMERNVRHYLQAVRRGAIEAGRVRADERPGVGEGDHGPLGLARVESAADCGGGG